MPIYEYQCKSCSKSFEQIQKISDDPLTDCPECGQAALVKLVSAAAFRLKGQGWYETDFKKSEKRNLAQDEKSTSSEESGSGASGDKPGGDKANKKGKESDTGVGTSGTKESGAGKDSTSSKGSAKGDSSCSSQGSSSKASTSSA